VKLYWTTDMAAWEDLAATCPGASYFHRGPWLGAVAEALGGRFEGAICELASDAVGLVPILRRPALGGWWAEGQSGLSGPFASYGGLISPEPLTPEQVEAVFVAIAGTLPNLRVVGNPHARGEHLPREAGGTTHLAAPAQLIDLVEVPTRPLGKHQDLFWVPGPQEFQADMFGGLEPAGAARPRAFYYHLFRRADAERLAMLLLREQGQPVAGLLVGLGGTIATNLGLVGSAAGQRLLLGHLAERLGPRVRWFDLGPQATALALDVPVKRHARALSVWTRQSAPLKLLTRLRRSPRRAS
jgi:hypothetical protein